MMAVALSTRLQRRAAAIRSCRAANGNSTGLVVRKYFQLGLRGVEVAEHPLPVASQRPCRLPLAVLRAPALEPLLAPLSLVPGVGVRHHPQVEHGLPLELFRQRVEDVDDRMVPAALLGGLWVHLGERTPPAEVAIADSQPRGREPARREVPQHLGLALG